MEACPFCSGSIVDAVALPRCLHLACRSCVMCNTKLGQVSCPRCPGSTGRVGSSLRRSSPGRSVSPASHSKPIGSSATPGRASPALPSGGSAIDRDIFASPHGDRSIVLASDRRDVSFPTYKSPETSTILKSSRLSGSTVDGGSGLRGANSSGLLGDGHSTRSPKRSVSPLGEYLREQSSASKPTMRLMGAGHTDPVATTPSRLGGHEAASAARTVSPAGGTSTRTPSMDLRAHGRGRDSTGESSGIAVVRCGKCDDLATVGCIKCDLALCKPCNAAHHVGKWKSHDLVLAEVFASHRKAADLAPFCDKQGHENHRSELFSLEEGRMMCVLCTLEDPKRADRDYVPLQQGMEQARHAAQEWTGKQRGLLFTIKERIEDCEVNMRRVEEHHEHERRATQQAFEKLRQALEAKETDILNQLEQDHSQQLASLGSSKETLLERLGREHTLMKEAERHVERPSLGLLRDIGKYKAQQRSNSEDGVLGAVPRVTRSSVSVNEHAVDVPAFVTVQRLPMDYNGGTPVATHPGSAQLSARSVVSSHASGPYVRLTVTPPAEDSMSNTGGQLQRSVSGPGSVHHQQHNPLSYSVVSSSSMASQHTGQGSLPFPPYQQHYSNGVTPNGSFNGQYVSANNSIAMSPPPARQAAGAPVPSLNLSGAQQQQQVQGKRRLTHTATTTVLGGHIRRVSDDGSRSPRRSPRQIAGTAADGFTPQQTFADSSFVQNGAYNASTLSAHAAYRQVGPHTPETHTAGMTPAAHNASLASRRRSSQQQVGRATKRPFH